MSIAFVLGNGVSRKGIDLHLLQKHGSIYGCNALYRDFTPNVLVATDAPIANTIQQSGYSLSNTFYTRKPIPGSGALPLCEPFMRMASGPNAVALAANEHGTVILLGFDIGANNEKLNNIYLNTDHYPTSEALSIRPDNWTYQLKKVFNHYPDTTFIRVLGDISHTADILNQVSNYSQITLPQFFAQYLPPEF